MNNWNHFLTEHLADGSLESSRATPGDEVTRLVGLAHQGLLTVEGPDAAKFLQGQVTCDVRELLDPVTRLGAQCTLKGRMLISFRALQLDPQRIFMRMPAELVNKAQETLGKYIVFSKAKLHNRSDIYRGVGVYGAQAEACISQIFGASPQLQDEWLCIDENVIIKLNEQRYECWLVPEQAEKLWRDFETLGCRGVSQNFWTLLDIRAGIGEVRLETTELFTPQALNFQLINGINFHKGCYTGQEIVARLHYRGTLKQHMYRVAFAIPNGHALPEPGASIVNAEHRPAGEIVMAAYAGTGSAEALAVISEAYLAEVFLTGEPGQKLEQLALPYAIPSEEKS